MATRLGPNRTWQASALLHAAVIALAVDSLVVKRGAGPGLVAAGAGIAVIAVGVMAARRGATLRRERAWESQAAGVGLLAVGWVWALRDAVAL